MWKYQMELVEVKNKNQKTAFAFKESLGDNAHMYNLENYLSRITLTPSKTFKFWG